MESRERDCTPDLQYVIRSRSLLSAVTPKKGFTVYCIREHFVGFLNVHSTTGRGLCESFLGHLDTLGLNISKSRSQSYDNGSNMQGISKVSKTEFLCLVEVTRLILL